MKKSIILIIAMLISGTVSSQQGYTVLDEIKVNNDSILIQVLSKDAEKYWKITNLMCEKIMVPTKTEYIYVKNKNGVWVNIGGRIASGNILKKGTSELYVIDYLLGDPIYDKECPNFCLKWKNLDNPKHRSLGDCFIRFCNGKIQKVVEKI